MTTFLIDCVNRPGELAKVSLAIAAAGVNITSIATVGLGDNGVVGLTTSDDGHARTALQEAGLIVREYDVVMIRLANEPGTLAAASRRLADAGVNVEYVAPTAITTAEATIAIGVTDAAAARKALGDLAA